MTCVHIAYIKLSNNGCALLIQMCSSKMLDVTETAVNVDNSLTNVDLSKCCNTESLLLTKLWNGDGDIMDLLLQRVSNYCCYCFPSWFASPLWRYC